MVSRTSDGSTQESAANFMIGLIVLELLWIAALAYFLVWSVVRLVG
jgi:hypothetical protein